MIKLPDGSRITYDGLVARYDALAAELAQAKARLIELSAMKPATMRQALCEIEAAVSSFYRENNLDGMFTETLDSALDGARTALASTEAPPSNEETIKDAARYRFIRQSEADLSREAEIILAAVWAQISLKGVRMDEIIDKGIKAAAAIKEIEHGG